MINADENKTSYKATDKPHVTKNGRVLLKIMKSCSAPGGSSSLCSFTAGEICGQLPDVASDMVSRGLASYVEPIFSEEKTKYKTK